ncbi:MULTISPECIES: peptidoglycan-binding protein [Desertifilum]|uniref:peptidoglycan-binding protein n=1 Tax=Desertifilum TaxID=1185872 RepID=UPI000A4D94E4|nr:MULTISPECIES: peptidoglycan-binding protein [Desertifilum]MDA0212806.1 peptidoglycan-binding protein [Cyanobacteria bacterium FC1]
MSYRFILLLVSCIPGWVVTPSLAQTAVLMPQSVELTLTQADPVREAMVIAQQASDRGKTAQTADEWADLADRWQQAADLMASVSPQSPQASLAQQKAAEYRRNREIAVQEEEKRRTQASNSVVSPLGPGSQGDRVRELQQGLQTLGYYAGAIDATYTESTLKAVSAFQQAQGLEVDGWVGQTTWDRLQRAQQPIVASSPSPSPRPQTQVKSQRRRNWVRWILIGAIAVTATGGFSLLLLKLLNRNRFEDEEEWEETEADEFLATAPPEGTMASDLPEKGEVQPPDSNGHHYSFFTPSEETPPPPTPDASLTPVEKVPIEETTRLAKINIVDELIQDLESPDRDRRRKAIWELGQRGASQATQPLVNLLLDSDSQQRSLILAALSEISIRTLKPMNRALAISLQDNNPEVRKNAIRDVTRLYELVTHVSQLMRYAAEDSDREVQETARWALNQLNRIRTTANSDQLPNWSDLENSMDRRSSDDEH